MTQHQGGQSGNQGNATGGGSGSAQGRPAVLDQVSTTTFDDLEQQYAEQDHAEFNRFTESFGWSQDESQAVWDWFGQRATQNQKLPQMEGFPAEGPGRGGK